MEGGRQLNLQLAAARAGGQIPGVDSSIVREEQFLPPPDHARAQTADPLERYLRLDPHQDAYVVYARTALQNELRHRGLMK